MTNLQNNKVQKEWGAKEISIAVITICIFAYIGVFLIWNFTNTGDHKPSSLFWDSRKEGYEVDPLHDRYGNQKK